MGIEEILSIAKELPLKELLAYLAANGVKDVSKDAYGAIWIRSE